MNITQEMFEGIMQLARDAYIAGVWDGRKTDSHLDALALYEKSSTKRNIDHLIKNGEVFTK